MSQSENLLKSIRQCVVWPLIPSVTVLRGHCRCVCRVAGAPSAHPPGCPASLGLRGSAALGKQESWGPGRPQGDCGVLRTSTRGCRDHTPQRRRVRNLQTVLRVRWFTRTAACGRGDRHWSGVHAPRAVSLVLTRPGHVAWLPSCCSRDDSAPGVPLRLLGTGIRCWYPP